MPGIDRESMVIDDASDTSGTGVRVPDPELKNLENDLEGFAIDDASSEGADEGTAPDPKAERLRNVQDVISRYVNQMLHGCGNADCKQMLCDNGRKNAPGRSIRRYTPRSARTIALTLASGPKPRSRLCAQRPQSDAQHQLDEGPRDPSSLAQLLADTKSINGLCEPPTTHAVSRGSFDPCENAPMLPVAHTLLDRAETLVIPAEKWTQSQVVRTEVVDLLCKALQLLLAKLPPPEKRRSVPIWTDLLIQDGLTVSEVLVKDGGEPNLMVSFLDAMDDPRALRLLDRWILLIGQLAEIEQQSISAPFFRSPSLERHGVCARIGDRVNDPEAFSGVDIFALLVWLKKAFLKRWDREHLLQSGTIPKTCLLLLEALKAKNPNWDEDTMSGRPHNLLGLTGAVAQLGETELVWTWLETFEIVGDRPIHLLDFRFLFSKKQRAFYFRTANHFRMQQAHNTTEKAYNLRTRAVRRSYDAGNDSRLSFLEDHYLLLSISRNNVLQDSFNQTWQRRTSELLRPLRVRLGEMDAFEVGHDLGGVQIEYFNLLCKEILSEERGMFTTDPATNLSYFRPGSLQPLYMFELFGMLFALAIYNGITLPISFPLVFYASLLAVPGHKRDPDMLKDGWPAMYKSMTSILEDDIEGLQCVFPMEANGLRLSIEGWRNEQTGSSERDSGMLSLGASVIEATSIVHYPETPNSNADTSNLRLAQAETTPQDLSNLSWPGWSFTPNLSGSASDLTPENKHNYTSDYIDWLTYSSVAPQWHHFDKGFFRILPYHQLRLLTPLQLQSLVEGHKTLSIPELRAATQYEGYQPESTYIHLFWSTISSFSAAKQFALLKFVTAAERLPAGGASHITFKIARVSHPGAEEQLPTSSTCFGTLMLPRYPSAEVLERKLSIALEMGGEGFGTG